MFGTHTTLSRLSRGIAVAASLVALTAPAALADPAGLSQDSTPFVTDTLAPVVPGSSGQFATTVPGEHGTGGGVDYYGGGSTRMYMMAAGGSGRFVTDTLAPGGATAETPGYRFVTDTLAPGGGLVTSSPAATGFDWSDAGIGAASSVGLLLILLGGAHLVSRRRSVVAV